MSQYGFDPEFCTQYGGRAEITQAVKQVMKSWMREVDPEDITEDDHPDSLYTEVCHTCLRDRI